MVGLDLSTAVRRHPVQQIPGHARLSNHVGKLPQHMETGGRSSPENTNGAPRCPVNQTAA